MAIEADICTKILDIITADVPEIKSSSFDRIRLATSDFQDHEIPAVQIWDLAQAIQHERGRIKVTWSLSLEIIMKSLYTGEVDQRSLWELRRKIQLALWAVPNLGIPGVIHMVYNSNLTDLHMVEPYYIARIDFDVLFYDDLTGSC